MEGDVTVTGFKRSPAKLEVTLQETNDPAAGSLTLVFEDHPLLLRQWTVLDPQGHTTGVNLENEQMDVKFPKGTFIFTPPNFGKGG
ncbi:outer-membrane lipoprotein carrier protein LolA, partial [Acinetobacter baumannii]